ncbi:hypothetical protein LCGC14_0913820 [marine sediment metagenome]|uniref:Uncharacterized protein n=1 Tax=marine sediment metagenome TaxID=412755 RepID=A0A0F9NSQ7_9ZZZZ
MIILLFIFHYLETINGLLFDYNGLVRWINRNPNFDFYEKEVWFLGSGLTTISLIVDVIIGFIVILIYLLIFLTIYWTVRDNQKSKRKDGILLDGETELELVKRKRK